MTNQQPPFPPPDQPLQSGPPSSPADGTTQFIRQPNPRSQPPGSNVGPPPQFQGPPPGYRPSGPPPGYRPPGPPAPHGPGQPPGQTSYQQIPPIPNPQAPAQRQSGSSKSGKFPAQSGRLIGVVIMALQVLTILVGFGTWGEVNNDGVSVTNSGFGTLKLNGGTLSGVKVPGLDATWSPPSPAVVTAILAVLIFIAAVLLVLDKYAMIAAAVAVALAGISFLQICYLWTDISSHVLGDSSASDDGSSVGAGWGLMVALFLVFLTLAAMALWWFARLVAGRSVSTPPNQPIQPPPPY